MVEPTKVATKKAAAKSKASKEAAAAKAAVDAITAAASTKQTKKQVKAAAKKEKKAAAKKAKKSAEAKKKQQKKMQPGEASKAAVAAVPKAPADELIKWIRVHLDGQPEATYVSIHQYLKGQTLNTVNLGADGIRSLTFSVTTPAELRDKLMELVISHIGKTTGADDGLMVPTPALVKA